MASGSPARLAFRSHSATSKAAIAWVASPLRPTEAPAQHSLTHSLPMSLGSSPISTSAISLAWANWPGPPARLE